MDQLHSDLITDHKSHDPRSKLGAADFITDPSCRINLFSKKSRSMIVLIKQKSR